MERATRYTILLALPDGHDAEHVQQAIIDKMGRPPRPLLNSLTWDQGAELALHRRITAALDMQVYFCDPRSPWQRDTNENTNGLLRQYFPKGTDLSGYSQDYLDAVADELNDRPRKPSTGPNPPKESSSCSTPCNTLNKRLLLFSWVRLRVVAVVCRVRRIGA